MVGVWVGFPFWSERKSRGCRPKTVDTRGHACLNLKCDYFAIANPTIHALVSTGRRGKQRIRYLTCQACGSCRTSRYGTPLYYLKTPLTQIVMVHLGSRKNYSCRPESIVAKWHHANRFRNRTPVMAAKLVRRRWSVRDLLQLPVPEGIWVDTLPATKGCR